MLRNSRTLSVSFAFLFVVGAALVAAFAGGSARAAGPPVFFDAGPGVGTGAPPALLGDYNMTPFASNAPLFFPPAPPHCGVPSNIAYQSLPTQGANRVTFTPTGSNFYFTASCLSGGFGQGGGNTYPVGGDVWCLVCDPVSSATLTPSTNTHAIYFYAMASACGTWDLQASSGGTNSPVFSITTGCGDAPRGQGITSLPHYFGFFTIGGATVPPITITQLTGPAFGIMVGEFAINNTKPSRIS